MFVLTTNHAFVILAHYSASVNESASIGTVVITVSASDKDHGSNAIIKYSIESSDGVSIIFW